MLKSSTFWERKRTARCGTKVRGLRVDCSEGPDWLTRRKVTEITEQLCGLEISAKVSRVAGMLDEELEEFRRPAPRRSSESHLFGTREVLGLSRISEAEVHWRWEICTSVD